MQQPNSQSPAAPPTITDKLAWAALGLSLAAFGAAGFAWYRVEVTQALESGAQRALVERVAAGHDAVVSTQDTLRRDLGEVADTVDGLAVELRDALREEAGVRQQSMDGFRREFDALSASLERVYEDIGRSVDTWLLEEVEQLLLLANQRLTLAGDVPLAISALRLADEKLGEVGDPALVPIRAAISDELAALAAVPQVDVTGAALRLNALVAGVVDLPLGEDMRRPQWQQAEQGDEAGAASEGGIGRQLFEDLSRLVKVRRTDDTQLPKLGPVQRFLVDANLQSMLRSAQGALLESRAELYRAALADAGDWLGRYFAGDDPAVAAAARTISELASLPLGADIPAVDGSLAMLRQHMREQQRR